MRITCQFCGQSQELAQLLLDRKERALLDSILELTGDFSPHHLLVREYIGLHFKGNPYKNLEKLLRKYQEVHELWERGWFDYRRVRYQISHQGLATGIGKVCDADVTGPLTNHNFLKKVLADISKAEASERGRKEETVRRQEEEEKRYSFHREHGDPQAASTAIQKLKDKYPAFRNDE